MVNCDFYIFYYCNHCIKDYITFLSGCFFCPEFRSLIEEKLYCHIKWEEYWDTNFQFSPDNRVVDWHRHFREWVCLHSVKHYWHLKYWNLGFLMFSLMALKFIKFALGCDDIFSIDSYILHIFLILCWRLMTVWWIWYCIYDHRYCKIFIIQ